MKNRNFSLTVEELAKLCGVSVGTVDRALNGRKDISPATKERILSVAKAYGYVADTKAPRLIGLVLFDLYNAYFSELVMHFEAEAKRLGYSVVLMFSNKNCAEEMRCIKDLYCMGVSALVLCPVNQGQGFSSFLQSLKIPVFTVGNRVEKIPHVGIDDYAAMKEAAAIWAERYDSLLYYAPALDTSENITAQRERYRGFCDATKENRTLLVTEFDRLADCEGAVVCPSDYYALQVLAKYPHRAVMGFDNVGLFRLYSPLAATVDSNSPAVARAVMDGIVQNRRENVTVAYQIT